MAAVRRALFVCSLCLAWCGVALAAKDAKNDEAIEQVKEKAREAFDRSDKALALEYAVLRNGTNLRKSLEDAAATVIIAADEEKAEFAKWPPNAKQAVESLAAKLSEAVGAVKQLLAMKTKFKAHEISTITEEFREKMNLDSTDAKDAIEIQRLAERAADFWKGITPFFELQLSNAQDATRKTKAAMEAAKVAAGALSAVDDRTNRNTKSKIRKANGMLPSSVKQASSMVTAAEVVKEKAPETPQLFSEVAKVHISPDDVQEEKGGKKLPEGSIAENAAQKPTADTSESNKNDPTTAEPTAPETKAPETRTPETSKPETSKPETIKPETRTPETKKNNTMKDNTTKTEKRAVKTKTDNTTAAARRTDSMMTNDTTKHNTTKHNTTKTEKRAAETKTDNTTAAEAKAEETTTNHQSPGSSLPHASVLAISGVAVTSVLLLLARVVAGMVSV